MNNEGLEAYFNKLNMSDSFGHAFLLYNSNYEEVKTAIENVINQNILGVDIELEKNPDVYIIKPEKNVIKKEIIKDLELDLNKTSQNSKAKVYIITECEKLNSHAANSLLKVLEEPEANIYAFLLTERNENVLSTIKSRCQIIQISKNKMLNIYETYNEEMLNYSLNLVMSLESVGCKAIVYNNDYYKSNDKEELKKTLNLLEYFYMDCLNCLNKIEPEYFFRNIEDIKSVSKKQTDNGFTKKILLINEYLNLLELNLNINLFIDKIFIELGMIEND